MDIDNKSIMGLYKLQDFIRQQISENIEITEILQERNAESKKQEVLSYSLNQQILDLSKKQQTAKQDELEKQGAFYEVDQTLTKINEDIAQVEQRIKDLKLKNQSKIEALKLQQQQKSQKQIHEFAQKLEQFEFRSESLLNQKIEKQNQLNELKKQMEAINRQIVEQKLLNELQLKSYHEKMAEKEEENRLELQKCDERIQELKQQTPPKETNQEEIDMLRLEQALQNEIDGYKDFIVAKSKQVEDYLNERTEILKRIQGLKTNIMEVESQNSSIKQQYDKHLNFLKINEHLQKDIQYQRQKSASPKQPFKFLTEQLFQSGQEETQLKKEEPSSKSGVSRQQEDYIQLYNLEKEKFQKVAKQNTIQENILKELKKKAQ